ncbi:NUT family member 2G-like isoform X1 [Cebus imitator]|uniref:NUT family member 2G-like isoform X1 n=1 Tax=Cebus imitator TaxID=2715852 RepID=UPI00189C3A12|nr:NUT family member 2G-like isoform X1 [Cebus imitator]
MASNGAYPVLGPSVTENPGTSMPVFTALSFATLPPGPAHGPPLVTVVVPPGGPPVLSAFPRTPKVAGQDGQNSAGASNILVQMRTEVGPMKAPQAQTLVLTQAPLIWQAPGAVGEGVACPPPRPLAAAPVLPAMAAQVIGGTQACEGGWSHGLPPPAPLAAPQPAPIVAPGNAGPWPQGAHGEGSQAPYQAKAPPEDSCNSKSVYENFRLWQHYKPLARRHLPQSPDTEALSCFFIPVLRSLARWKPRMTLEEGLWRAVQEWQHTSNFDRMIYYEMAGKFLEFEAEEEMKIQKSQWMKGPQCLPPPAVPRLEPQGTPAPQVANQPVYLPSKAGPKALLACLPSPRPQRPAETKAHLPPLRPQEPAETKAPEEIPPEVVQEYVDIMEELLGPPDGATGELKAQWEEGEVEQEGDGMLLDPGLLSYIDNLCSQKDFVTKVEAVIHPRFLEELLSPDPHMDFLALSQELEQEEGLTLAQAAPSDAPGTDRCSGSPDPSHHPLTRPHLLQLSASLGNPGMERAGWLLFCPVGAEEKAAACNMDTGRGGRSCLTLIRKSSGPGLRGDVEVSIHTGVFGVRQWVGSRGSPSAGFWAGKSLVQMAEADAPCCGHGDWPQGPSGSCMEPPTAMTPFPYDD